MCLSIKYSYITSTSSGAGECYWIGNGRSWRHGTAAQSAATPGDVAKGITVSTSDCPSVGHRQTTSGCHKDGDGIVCNDWKSRSLLAASTRQLDDYTADVCRSREGILSCWDFVLKVTFIIGGSYD